MRFPTGPVTWFTEMSGLVSIEVDSLFCCCCTYTIHVFGPNRWRNINISYNPLSLVSYKQKNSSSQNTLEMDLKNWQGFLAGSLSATPFSMETARVPTQISKHNRSTTPNSSHIQTPFKQQRERELSFFFSFILFGSTRFYLLYTSRWYASFDFFVTENE